VWIWDELTDLEEKGASEEISERSLMRISFERREFLLARGAPVLDADHLVEAEAGVTGDLNTVLWASSNRGDGKMGVLGDAIGKDDSNLEGTSVDSPTQPGALSVTTIPLYSYPEVRPSPWVM
jgi:hypothetical protein